MATTTNGIYYPNDGTKSADILTDLKTMAESIDKNVQKNKYDDTEIKEDISDLQEEQQTQNKNIENLQTNDNKQDELISKLKNAALNAETEEAKSLHIKDANKFGQLEVFGNHEQETRSGKNKLNLANIQQTTKNGITCTYNEDGSVTFDGTCTADNTIFAINNININAVKNQTTMSAFYEKGSISAQEEKTAYIYARINTSDYSKILSFIIADLNNSNPVISEQYKSGDALLNQFSFRIEAGTILNNFTVKVMVTDTPEESTEYEQYGSSPSPKYPSPVKCLGSNKNIFSDNDTYNGYIGGEVGQEITYNSSTLSKTYKSCCKLTKDKNYMLSFNKNNPASTSVKICAIADDNENILQRLNLNPTQETMLITPTQTGYLYLTMDINATNIKIEEGDTATSYSPYRTR